MRTELEERRAPLLNDVIFHYVFAHEAGINCLKTLVNTVLEASGFRVVQQIQIRNPFNLGEFAEGKQSVIDIRARDSDGRWFNIEVQNLPHSGFFSRTLYYWATTYSHQLIVGDRYTELDPTFGIHFIGFPLLPKPWPLHAHVELRMPQFKDRFLTDQLSLEYLDFSQLSSFTFGDILDNKLLSLMYFLMHKGRSEDTHMAEIEKKYPELNEINTRFKKALHDDSVWIEAERREKFARDQIAIRQYAEEEGIEKGKDLGRTEVLSQMVTNMRSQGFSWEQISAISGRSIKELTQLPGTSKDLDS